ncbi:MAG TPA: type I 3-dehydroquinate dehydratase [Candidatus Polarisedimenticolia bacterium]|nr:type I 3-dehydroquinate dehydratase [Candidatus Polarisedimenticolia bacterium]
MAAQPPEVAQRVSLKGMAVVTVVLLGKWAGDPTPGSYRRLRGASNAAGVLCWRPPRARSAPRRLRESCLIVLSLKERDPAVLRRAILSAPQKADALEVRLDGLDRPDPPMLSALFGGAPRPIIASCRRASDGGGFRGSESRRRDLLWAAVKAGASYVDVEHGSGASSLAREAAALSSLGVILSHHDRSGMPRDPMRLYRAMARVPGVKAIKIVGTARRPSHILEARDLLERARGKGPPLIAFCMGAAGAASRVLALEWGSWATYAAAGPGRETAPGQVTLTDLIGVYRIEDIDDETRYAGIVGCPLGHTLSPVIHNAAYAADGLNFRYLPFETPPSGLRDVARVARALKVRGLSVTAPYKIAAYRKVDLAEPLARRVGAVNTVLCDGRRLVGFNTDASGALAPLLEALEERGLRLEEMTVAIVGSGGAARAVAHAAAPRAGSVIVSSRSERPGRAIARAVAGRFVPLSRLAGSSYDVLVNCTPVGMNGAREGRGPALPVPRRAVKGRLVYDVIYRPEATGLLREAKARGIPTLGGLEMLLRQAAEQHVLFTGRSAPLEAMREAARQALGGRQGG